MKKIIILGSTGTIGQNCLDVIRSNPSEFEVVALTAGSNYQLLAKQVQEFKPQMVAMQNASKIDELAELVDCEIVSGDDGILQIAAISSDITICAIIGIAGLKPTMLAVQNSSEAAIANKESIIVAGHLLLAEAKKHNCKITPIDSEHDSIAQTIGAKGVDNIHKCTITASGGAFWQMDYDEMKNISPQQATKHPNWVMGAKISVDSSTLVNKALELIEAHILFNLAADKLDAVIHPQSIVHSLIEYDDAMVVSGLYAPDMRVPIANVLGVHKHQAARLDITAKPLEFFEIDRNKFRSIDIAYDVMQAGGTSATIFNAANELAVEEFLSGRIGFINIYDYISTAMEKISPQNANSIDELIDIDNSVRKVINGLING